MTVVSCCHLTCWRFANLHLSTNLTDPNSAFSQHYMGKSWCTYWALSDCCVGLWIRRTLCLCSYQSYEGSYLVNLSWTLRQQKSSVPFCECRSAQPDDLIYIFVYIYIYITSLIQGSRVWYIKKRSLRFKAEVGYTDDYSQIQIAYMYIVRLNCAPVCSLCQHASWRLLISCRK